jgi:hypothetical protein
MERERRNEPYDTGFGYRPKRRRGRAPGTSQRRVPSEYSVIRADRYPGDTRWSGGDVRNDRQVSFGRNTPPADSSIESGLQFREDRTPWRGRAKMYAAQLRHEGFPHRFSTLFQQLRAH